jgi:hypothetical protein
MTHKCADFKKLFDGRYTYLLCADCGKSIPPAIKIEIGHTYRTFKTNKKYYIKSKIEGIKFVGVETQSRHVEFFKQIDNIIDEILNPSNNYNQIPDYLFEEVENELMITRTGIYLTRDNKKVIITKISDNKVSGRFMGTNDRYTWNMNGRTEHSILPTNTDIVEMLSEEIIYN